MRIGGMLKWKSLAPYAFLLAAVAAAYRVILFTKNGFIPFDMPVFHLPPAVLETQALRQGSFPLWDPFTYCGFPLIAHIAMQVFYPFRIASVAAGAFFPRHLDMFRILEWELIFHVWLAAIFTFLLARRLGVGQAPALFSGTAFALGCYFASQAEHIGAIETAAWLPLCWLCVLRLAESPSFARIALAGLVFALVWLSGFPPSGLIVFLSSVLFAALLVVARRAKPRLLLFTGGALVLSVLLSAVQLIPAAQLSALSLGASRANWRGTGGGLPLKILFTLVWPDYLHAFDLAKFDPHYELTLSYVYCGIVTLLLALLAVARRPSRTKLIFTALLVISGIWMLGDSIVTGRYLFLALPSFIRGIIYPQHWMAPFSLCLALLAGFGLQELSKLRGWGYAIVALAAADLIFAGSNRPMNTVIWYPESIAIDSSIDGLGNELAALRKAASTAYPPWRLDVVNDSGNWVAGASLTGVPSPSGYNSLALARFVTARAQTTGHVIWAYAPVVDVTSRMLDFLSVRFLLTTTPIDPSVLSRSSFSVYMQFPGRYVYENRNCLPHFHMVKRVLPAANAAEALRIVTSASWMPAEEAAVEGIAQAKLLSPGTVHVRTYTFNRVLLETDSPGSGFLVSSEANYPGWKASIDGKEAEILYTNVAFRGLAVPAGRHTIEFRFVPLIVLWSGLISAVALAGVVGVMLKTRNS